MPAVAIAIAEQGDVMPKSEPDHEDEQHRKFREALEAKKAQTHKHAEGRRNQGVGEAQNDKQMREFRRKSGS